MGISTAIRPEFRLIKTTNITDSPVHTVAASVVPLSHERERSCRRSGLHSHPQSTGVSYASGAHSPSCSSPAGSNLTGIFGVFFIT